VDLKYAGDDEKIAMAGDKRWQHRMMQLMKPFTSADIKYFDLAGKEKVKAWIEN